MKNQSNGEKVGRFFFLFLELLLLVALLGGLVYLIIGNMPIFQERQNDKLEKIKVENIELPEDKLEEQPVLEPEQDEEPKEETVKSVTLLFAGDVLFDDSYSPMVSLKQRENGVEDCFSKDLLKEMREADIFMINNEFTYTNRGEPLEDKSYTFRTKPENVKYLFDMGVDIVSLANNHSFDFGEISLLDSIDTLEKAGMPMVGAGRNLDEASAAYYFEIDGIKIGFVSATQIERFDDPPTRGADENQSGVFRSLYPENLYNAVTEAEKECDFLVAYVHWGTEKMNEIDWSQIEQGPGLVEAGADLVIGAHPHVLQGVEAVNDTPIAYSLGNFWFNSFTQDSCVVKVVINEEGIESFQLIPTLQKGCVTSLMHGSEKQRVLEHVQSLSKNITIDAEGYVYF